MKQIGQDINGEAIADNSGNSVALSADGTRVAIGAVGNDGGSNYGGTCDEYELPGNEAWCRAYGNDGEAGLAPNENCCVCSKLVEK